MPTFAAWLHDRSVTAQDPNLTLLQTFAETTPHWPFWSDNLADYENFLNQLNPAPANLAVLRNTLHLYFGQWLGEQHAAPAAAWNAGQKVLVTVGFVFALAIAVGLYNSDFYTSLGKTEQARGLVTFLFVLSTTGVIMITTIAIFYFQDGNDIKNRFAHAKDLLTIVIGVLGTIMGFYFGQASPESGAIGISDMVVAPSPAKAGKPLTLTGTLAGGKSPYIVTIDFKSDPPDAVDVTKMSVKGHKSENGSISETIPVPADAKKATLSFTVSVKDSKSATVQSHGTLDVEPSAPATPPPQGQQPQPAPAPK